MSNGGAAQRAEADGKDISRERFAEGIHFYYEGGFMVFTAQYLLERGYCCGNGCRHCPYEGKDKRTNQRR